MLLTKPLTSAPRNESFWLIMRVDEYIMRITRSIMRWSRYPMRDNISFARGIKSTITRIRCMKRRIGGSRTHSDYGGAGPTVVFLSSANFSISRLPHTKFYKYNYITP
jgi:hypothetical protein